MLILSSCSSVTTTVHQSNLQLFDDSLFENYTQYSVEDEQQVFALNDEAEKFAQKLIYLHRNPSERLSALVRALLVRSEYSLVYSSHANSIASETFDNRSANCLSMSILAYSIAKSIGFDVKFQHVEVPEFWVNREGIQFLNGHINLKVAPQQIPSIHRFNRAAFELDFDPYSPKDIFSKHFIEKQRVLAMFYNNKGADAFFNQEYSKAYSYYKHAILTDPTFPEPVVNLGVLYRVNDREDLAENAYQQALSLGKDNLTSWENLAILYDISGRHEKAQDIARFIERRRATNPYYHSMLGEQALHNQHYERAISHFRKAIKLDNSVHEFYFGLAKAHYILGDAETSLLYMHKAKRKSLSEQDKKRYSNKLSLLNVR